MRKHLSLIILLNLFGLPPLGGRVDAELWASPVVERPIFASQVLDEEDYSVYAALLKEKFINRDTRRLVIESYTSVDAQTYADLEETIKRAAPLTKETTDNFRAKRRPKKLRDRFNLPLQIDLLSKSEIARVFKRTSKKSDGWEKFYHLYPSSPGILRLSRIGFNSDKSQALIFVAHSCGLLCGEGNYFVMAKKDGEWTIVKELTTWVS